MNKKTKPQAKTVYEPQSPALLPAVLLFGIFFLLLFGCSIWKFANYGDQIDFPIFLEAFKNACNGEIFTNHYHYRQQIKYLNIPPEVTETASMFGMHFRPSLYLLLPFFYLFPTPQTLLFLQTFVVASAVFPIYLLFFSRLQRRDHTVLATLCITLHPIFLSATTSFFPSFLAMACLLWAFYFLEGNRLLLFSLCLLITLGLKEIMAVPVLMAGIYCFFTRSRLLGGLVCFTAPIYLLLCTEFIIPFFALGEGYHFSNTYGGTPNSSVYDSIVTLLLSPNALAAAVFRPDVFIYLANILTPLLFLPVFSLEFLLCLPLLAQNIFAVHLFYALFITGHLTAPLLPFLFLGFARVIEKLNNKLTGKATKMLLTACIAVTLLFSISISKEYRIADPTLKAASSVLLKHLKPGETITSNVNSTFKSQFMMTNPVLLYPESPRARWNVVTFDRKLCTQSNGPSTQENTIDENLPLAAVQHGNDINEKQFSMVVCAQLAKDCTMTYFDELYYPNKDLPARDGVDFRLVVFRNICYENTP